MKKIFCCPGFEHRVADAGQRGIAVLVRQTSKGLGFVLQSRGVAFNDESTIRPMPNAADITVNISCEIGLRFCPFCGKCLQDLIKISPEAFADLAEKHKRYSTLEGF